MAYKARRSETGRARAGRLLRETVCECKDPAIISRPSPKKNGRYIHQCAICSGLVKFSW